MIIDSNFTSRLESLLTIYQPVLCSTAAKVFSASEWGMQDKMKGNLAKLQDLQLLSLYLIMLEWKTYEQNTFFLELDDDGCPLINYPATVVEQPEGEKTLVECLCRYFHCMYGIDVEHIFKIMGVSPVGQVPDGMSYMVIKEDNDDCNDNIFEINKP